MSRDPCMARAFLHSESAQARSFPVPPANLDTDKGSRDRSFTERSADLVESRHPAIGEAAGGASVIVSGQTPD